jgi:hypothetical protein
VAAANFGEEVVAMSSEDRPEVVGTSENGRDKARSFFAYRSVA